MFQLDVLVMQSVIGKRVPLHIIMIVSFIMITSDMQGMVWGEPELSHVWEFDHMVFFHIHNVNEV